MQYNSLFCFQTEVVQPSSPVQSQPAPYTAPPGTYHAPASPYPAPPGTAKSPTGSHLVHHGTGQSEPVPYFAPPETHTYPSAPYESAYPSCYPAAGVNNPTSSSGYTAQVPPQTQQQYYPHQASNEPGNINETEYQSSLQTWMKTYNLEEKNG